MNYNFLKQTEIGQSSEVVTRNINDNDANTVKHMPLMLTTTQRLNLAPTLRTHNRVVFDLDNFKWYSWSMVGGVYDWKVMNFSDNYFLYNIQKREKTYTMSQNTSSISLDSPITPYDSTKEIMLVSLNGSPLIEGQQYTITSNSTIGAVGGGIWYAGQKLTITILYGKKTTDQTELGILNGKVTALEAEVNALEDIVLNKNIIRVWS